MHEVYVETKAFEEIAEHVRRFLKHEAIELRRANCYSRSDWVDQEGKVHQDRLLSTDEIYARLKLEVIARLSRECKQWTDDHVRVLKMERDHDEEDMSGLGSLFG